MASVSYKAGVPDAVVVNRGQSSTSPLGEEDLLLATTLVEDAIHGRFLRFKTDSRSVRSYRLYYHWSLRWLQHVAVMTILALALFEKPAVVPCEPWVTTLVEIIILSYFIFRVFHSAHFQNKTAFWKDSKNIVATLAIGLAFVDLVCYYVWYYALPDADPIRWSRCLRPLFIVNFPQGRQVRTAFRNIRRSLAEIVYVLFLLLCSILLFALLASKLFSKRQLTYPDGRPYMATYWDCLWSMYVLVTTSNNPDVMMPAYDANGWFALFFIIYLILNLYIFMHILLAVIFNSYKKNLKNEVKESVYAKRRKLAEAFDVMKTQVDGGEVGSGPNHVTDAGGTTHGSGGVKYALTYKRWQQLLRALDPKRSAEQADILLCVLDSDGDGQLGKKDFLQMTEVLEVRLTEVKERLTCFEAFCPVLYFSSCSYRLRSWVQHRYFRYFFDLAIVVNAISIGIDQFEETEWFFLGLFMFEILLKLYSYGVWRFVSAYWNVFDTVVIVAALIATIIERVTDMRSSREVVDIVLVIRCLRLVKIFTGFDRFKVILMTVVNIGPSILTYGGVLFVFYYFFAMIGMEAFRGRVTFYGYNESAQLPSQLFCGNPLLNGTDFYKSRYCSNNFNDLLSAFIVLFELTVVNQWHILASGFATVTHEAAKIYFLLFHLACVVLIVNIFVAFILEAFMLEYSLSTNKYESAIELKIKEMGYEFGPSKSLAARFKRTAVDKAGLVENAEELPPPPSSGAAAFPASGDARAAVASATAGLSADVGPASAAGISDDEPDKVTRFRLQTRVFKKVGILLQQMFESEIDPEDMGPDVLAVQDDTTDAGSKMRKLTFDLI